MTRLTTTSWLVSLLLSTIPAPANSDCQDEDFAFPGVTATAIPLRFRNAVLRIESGGSRGSGFVIDADRGLVLTAAHVVRGASLSQDRIIAHSTASSEPLRLALRADLFEEAVDLALLQVENLETLDQVIPVDVMTDVPRGMPEGVVLGYPWADTFAETSIEMVRVHLSGGQPTFEHQGVVFRSLLSASTQTEDGISGGPLVALGGAAVAVAVATKGAKTYFSSLSELPRLLSKVELSEEMQDLDSQLQKGKVLPEELVRRMNPNSPTTHSGTST